MPLAAAQAVTCGDVADGNIDADNHAISAENREFAFIVASKITAKGILESLEDDGAKNGFETVLDVYANTLVPIRAAAEDAWQHAEKEHGGAIEAINAICTNRDEKVFNLYMSFYHFMVARTQE